MRTAMILAMCVTLCSQSSFAEESETIDHERPLVQQGVLGTMNVLRELDVKTWTNRVTVTSSLSGSPFFHWLP